MGKRRTMSKNPKITFWSQNVNLEYLILDFIKRGLMNLEKKTRKFKKDYFKKK
jgi:hypothetical protein